MDNQVELIYKLYNLYQKRKNKFMSNDNNHNNNHTVKKVDWKMYFSLFLYALLGLAIGYAVAKGVIYLINRPATKKAISVINNSATSTVDFVASTTASFEGDHTAAINFKNSADLKVTQGEGSKSKYYYIADSKGNNVATVYMSYEGGRGYSATDYINNVIRKAVPAASPVATVTYASSSWAYSSTAASEWHVAPAKNGEWLVVMENKKANHDALASVYETLNIK